MIDIAKHLRLPPGLFRLDELVRLLKKNGSRRRMHFSTVWRWSTKGVRGRVWRARVPGRRQCWGNPDDRRGVSADVFRRAGAAATNRQTSISDAEDETAGRGKGGKAAGGRRRVGKKLP